MRASIFAVVVALGLSLPLRAASLGAPEPITHEDCVYCHRDAMSDVALTNGNHPVGNVYPGTSEEEDADAERGGDRSDTPASDRFRPASAMSGFGSTVANDFLVAGRVECTSCHLSHFVRTDRPKRLRLDLSEPGAAARFCSACHRVQ